MTADLYVQRLPTPEAWADLVPEWELLDEQILPCTPFTSPLWIRLWWKHFRRQHVLFHDQFLGHTIRDSNGRLVGIAPLMQTDFPGFRPSAVRMVQFFGTDSSLTEIRGVICRREDQARVVLALAEHFLRQRGEWDVFRWNGLHQSTCSHGSLTARLEFMARRDLPAYIIELPGTWDELKGRVSTNMRKNLRKAYEFLERDGHRFAVSVVDQPNDIGPAIERFLRLHAARSQAVDMIHHPNKFANGRNCAFLTEYLENAASRGRLRIFELAVDDSIVANRLAFSLGRELYLYFAGFLPAWGRYSVMTLLMTEIIRWAIAHGFDRVNLSTGRDQSKLRWKPVEVVFRDAVQISPAPRSQLAAPAFKAYEALSRIRDQTQSLRAMRLRQSQP